MTLSPTEVHETLDRRGLLDHAEGPGTYALEVTVPDDKESVERAFRDIVDVSPREGVINQLAESDTVAYVGASGNVYDRLQDHAEGEKRKALFLQAFEAVDIINVWPSETPFISEFNRAMLLSQAMDWTVWTDGDVV